MATKCVYKYPLDAQPCKVVNVVMPAGARVLHVEMQHGQLCMWAMVDPGEIQKAVRGFVVVGTGHAFKTTGEVYINTIFMHDKGLVFHAFEVTYE